MSPQNLTEAQRRWVKAAAEDAARHVQRRSVVGFLILLIGLIVALGVGQRQSDQADAKIEKSSQEGRKAIVETGRIVSVSGCNRDYETRVAVRKVLQASKKFTRNAYERLDLTPEELQLRLDFYDDQLDAVPLPDCRESEDVISDDPNEVPAMPEPLYPGSDK